MRMERREMSGCDKRDIYVDQPLSGVVAQCALRDRNSNNAMSGWISMYLDIRGLI